MCTHKYFNLIFYKVFFPYIFWKYFEFVPWETRNDRKKTGIVVSTLIWIRPMPLPLLSFSSSCLTENNMYSESNATFLKCTLWACKQYLASRMRMHCGIYIVHAYIVIRKGIAEYVQKLHRSTFWIRIDSTFHY